MSRDPRRFSLPVLGGLLIAAVLVHAIVVLFDTVDTNQDFDAHVAWATQFSQAFHSGNPYPRWMPSGNHGLGEPVTLFYSPLFYFLTAMVDWAMPYTWASIKAVMCLSSFATGVVVWLLLWRITSPSWAFLGAVAVQAAPMVFMVFHYFNGFPWGASFAVYAFVLLLTVRFFSATPPRFSPMLAFAAALLVFAHVVSAMMVFLCLGVSVLVMVRVNGDSLQDGIARILWWGASIAIGILLSMVYLWPALTSMDLVAASNWQTAYPPWDAFAFPTITAIMFGMRWFTFQWVVPALILLSVVFGIVAHRRWAGEVPEGTRNTLLFLSLVSLVSLFFSSELSYPLWMGSSPLRWVQSPHRFEYVAVLPALVVNTFWLGWLWSRKNLVTKTAFAVPIAASFVLWGLMTGRLLALGDVMTALKTNQVPAYGSYAEYRVAAQTPAAAEWIRAGGLTADCRAKGLHCEPVSGEGYAWLIEAKDEASLRLPVLSFPSWRATVGDVPVQWRTDVKTGLIEIDVQAGSQTVRLSWARLPQERVGAMVSIAAALLLMGFSAYAGRRRA